MLKQLALSLRLRDEATFANFYSGDNATLIRCLQEFVTMRQQQFVYLWGQNGVGRSHLLQACCHAVSANEHTVMYLALEDHTITPAVLENLEQFSLVCIDDIDAVLGQSAWEEALFHFYNRAKEHHTRLLVSAQVVPTQLACNLPDLTSRLCWGLSFQVHGLDDEQKLQVLKIRADHRGWHLSDEVGQFLLRHTSRNMADLFVVLERLDQASMVAKRRVTIPFAKEVLTLDSF